MRALIVTLVLSALTRVAAAEPDNKDLFLIGLAMVPPTYFIGVTLHEGSHALAAEMMGADVTEIRLFPPGTDPKANKFRFGWVYAQGLRYKGEKIFFYLAPKITDSLLLGGFAALILTNTWPDNRYAQLALTGAHHTGDPMRLPVDRVFTVEGFGTVVTGTLWRGSVRTGDVLELLPRGAQVRVRRVQVHGETVDESLAGQRTALALHGVARDQVTRGDGDFNATELTVRSEQSPFRESRITLTEDLDALGMPRVALDWRIAPEDDVRMRRAMVILARELGAAGLARTWVPGDASRFVWRQDPGGHHMGATRMGTDPAVSVVNADSRTHQVENLYITGGSVFTTGGDSNPTLTIVALAHRLADRLKQGASSMKKSV